jgi:hypothetical protein
VCPFVVEVGLRWSSRLLPNSCRKNVKTLSVSRKMLAEAEGERAERGGDDRHHLTEHAVAGVDAVGERG